VSNKKSALDILGESHIPTDLLTPTLGSNYGLDGFEDMQYGMGVLEGVLNPEYTEAPALPTGVQLASAEDLDLHGFLEEGEPLTDLSWLDPSQLQDPERLPKDPESIPELEEAWGRSTDGVRVWDRDLDRANWQESLRDPTQKKAKLTSEHIRKIVSHAMRRSIQGHDVETVLREALESVGGEADALAPYLKPMREEHGLHGKVFVRASAYPGWGTGKWASEVRKWAPKAKYLLVTEHDLKTATWIESGRCKYTSKLAVTQVPWNEALNHYKPLLESTGRKVAGADPKKALQAAFLAKPKQARPDTENRPVQVTPDQRVSRKEAQEAFDSYTPKRAVYDPTAENEKQAQKRVEARVLDMAKRGLIPETEARALVASGGKGDVLLQAAARIASRVKSGKYQGQEGTLEALQALRFAEADRKLKDSLDSAARVAKLDPSADEYRVRVAKAENYIKGLTGRGILSEKVAKEILASKSDLQDKVRAAASLAFKVSSGEYRGDPNSLLGERALRAAEASRKAQEAEQSVKRIEAYDEVRAAALLERWVSTNRVSSEKVKLLRKELGGDSRKVAAAVAREFAQARKVAYQGTNRALEAQLVLEETRAQDKTQTLRQAQEELSKRAAREQAQSTLEARQRKTLHERVAKIEREIQRGLRGTPLRNFIAKTLPKEQAPEALRLLKSSLEGVLQDAPKEVKVYDQAQFSRVASEKQAKSVLAGQISKAANWLRRTMTEGFAGKDLDDMVSQRLSESLKQASESQVRDLRAQHEGVSGFLYVDAEAYSSPTGITGCEQGALKHRANKIPSVAEMPRCASCAMVRVREDGTRKCGVYNKVLADFAGEDLTRVRESNIRAANMTDVELTSSLFSPNYDPSEFGLENSNLEGISLELPEEHKISDVTFGGWDF
jgi:hypothetical protein